MNNNDSYPPVFFAGFWSRFFAFLIDVVIAGSLKTLLVSLPFAVIGISGGNSAFSLETVFETLVFLGYFVLFTKILHGQTLGKLILGLRVVSLNEERLTWTTVIVRECFGRYILTILWVLYGMIPFNKKKQHFVDMLCDTSVVTEKTIEAYEYGLQIAGEEKLQVNP